MASTSTFHESAACLQFSPAAINPSINTRIEAASVVSEGLCGSLLHSVHHCLISTLILSSIGRFLSDGEANRWARCSRRSHSDLQHYRFKRKGTIPRMISLSTPALRSPSAFGEIRHVGISTAREWLEHLPTLPKHVKVVTFEIQRVKELASLYPFTEDLKKLLSSPCCAYYGETTPMVPAPAPLIRLPSTVEHFFVQSEQRDVERWLDHLELPQDSRLRSFHFRELCTAWTTLPRFLRKSLPDCLQELNLPLSFCYSLKHNQPRAEHYPIRWPPNLTRLRLCCSANSPFAQGKLPPLPPTLTELQDFRSFGLEQASIPGILKNLPASITSLNWNHTPVLEIHDSWTFPAELKQLSFHGRNILKQPASSSSSSSLSSQTTKPLFCFPKTLQQLSILRFAHPEIIGSVLPDTLTSLSLGFDGKSLDRPFEGVQWPSQLRSLCFPNKTTRSLQFWTPPSQLTELDLGYSNVSLESVPLPATLRILIFGENVRSLEKVHFPPLLETIIFSDSKMPLLLVDKWHPPQGLVSLTVSQFQGRDMLLPSTLKRFSISQVPFVFLQMAELLPQSLEVLDLGVLPNNKSRAFPWQVYQFPPQLRCLRFTSDYLNKCPINNLPQPAQIPPTLTEFWVVGILSNVHAQKLEAWAEQTLPPNCAFCSTAPSSQAVLQS